MTILDPLIVVAAVAAVVGGWRLGFLARTASWLAMSLGLVLAVRGAPRLVDALGIARGTLVVLLLVAGMLMAGAFIGQLLGLVVGTRMRAAVPSPVIALADRALGAAAGLVGVVAVVWFVAPTLWQIDGWASRTAVGSVLTRLVVHNLPEQSASPLDELYATIIPDAAVRGRLPYFSKTPDAGEPPGLAGLLDDGVEDLARGTTMRIRGTGCENKREGTGFVVDARSLPPGAAGLEGAVIVTNAHVVVGEDNLEVHGSDGSEWAASVIGFDPNRDFAVLYAPALSPDGLTVAEGEAGRGDFGAVFGYPNGGGLDIEPYRIHAVDDFKTDDIFKSHDVERRLYRLAASLHEGDSGAPMVSGNGTVVGVVFAVAADRKDSAAYALTPTELAPVLAQIDGDARTVETGECPKM